MAQWRSTFVLLISCTLVACGGDSDSSSNRDDPGQGSSGGGAGQEVPVRGGERLAWDQAVSSGQAIAGYSFRLYVDAAAAALTDVRCPTPIASGYQCSAVLPGMSPGRHTLELVAISNGLQSNSSAPIVVRVLAGQVTDENSTATFDETAPRVSSQGIVCLPESGSTCYQARVLATGVNRIDSLVAPAPDRALFIENGEHLRRLDGDVLSSPITLPELSGKRLLSLAIPDDEARGRLVFVVWAESSGPGIDMLGVTRYREVGASLGEPATIVVDVPIVAGTHAPAAFDDEDRLYVAVVAPQSDSGRPSVNPAILRFALDGAVPATNPASQIIVTSGFSQPGALAWDRDQRGLWLSGTDPRWASPVLTLPVAPDGQLGSLQTPELDVEGITGLPMAERPSVLLAPTRRASQSNTAQTGVWLVWSPGRVFWGMRAGTRTSLKPVTFGEIGVPTLIAQDPDQNLLLVTDSGLTGGATVWRLIVR